MCYIKIHYTCVHLRYSTLIINNLENASLLFFRVFGAPITRGGWCNTASKCPPLQPGKDVNIVGVEGALFGETISTDDHIDNNAWPRLLAIAERAWNEAPWEGLDGPKPEGMEEDFKR